MSRFLKPAIIGEMMLVPLLVFGQDLSNSDSSRRFHYLDEIFSRTPDPRQSTEAFFETLDQLYRASQDDEKPVTRLYHDIVDIMRDEDKANWKALHTTTEKIVFIKRFWRGNDPTPATSVNERLVEHYTRLRYAREKFSYFDPKGYDDRGMIYIQFGPPDDYIDDVVNNGTVPVLSWVYQRYGGPINFDFINEGFGYWLNSRLNEALRDFNPIAGLPTLQFLVSRRITLHPTYAQLSSELQEIQRIRTKDPNQVRKLIDRAINTYYAEVTQQQGHLPKAISEVLIKVDALACALNLAKFQGAGQKLDLVASYGFNPADLKSKADTLRVQIVAAVRDSALDICASRDTTYEFMPRSPQSSEAFVAATTYSLPPSKYYFLLDVNNPKGNQRGLRDFTVGLGPYPKEVLHLSTAIFATQVVPASDSLVTRQPLQRQNLAISPYPFATIKRSARLFVYFEIYDLKRDESGETFYEVEYEVNTPEKKGLSSLLASLNPFGKARGSISVTDTRRGKATTEPTHLQLDFSQLRGGNYNLVVRVTDKIANITKESKLQFELE
jgi:GWxTD domain-containing protein